MFQVSCFVKLSMTPMYNDSASVFWSYRLPSFLINNLPELSSRQRTSCSFVSFVANPIPLPQANLLFVNFGGKVKLNIRIIVDLRIQEPFTLRQVNHMSVLILGNIGLFEAGEFE
jgi:hypothetical protein